MNATARGMTLKTFSKTWLPLILIFILLVLVITAKGINTQDEYRDYEPESPGRSGTKAVIEVLKKQGIQTKIAYKDSDIGPVDRDTTLVLLDDGLDWFDITDSLKTKAQQAGRVILFGVQDYRLKEFGLDIDSYTNGVAMPGVNENSSACLPYIGKAKNASVTIVREHQTPGVIQCFRTDSGSLLSIWPAEDGPEYILVSDPAAFTNANVQNLDNAALALTLYGANPKAVFHYERPNIQQQSPANAPLWQLLPPWVFWAGMTLLFAALALMIAKGRRLGPLAREPLLVIISASEIEEARASLAREGKHASWAMSLIQSRARRKLRRALYLPNRASEEELTNTLAAKLNKPASELRALLYDANVLNEKELTQRSHKIDQLIQEVS